MQILQIEFVKKCLSTQHFRIFLCWTWKQETFKIKIWYISVRNVIIFKLAFYNRNQKKNDIPFIVLDTKKKVIKASILDSSHGLHWLGQSSKTVPHVIFGMLFCLGKSVVKNQTVDFPHLPLLSFGPCVKNMMQQVGMFRTSHFSFSFFL